MKRMICIVMVLGVLLALPVSGGEITSRQRTSSVGQRELNYKVITSRGSMRLVQYTRQTNQGQVSYIRAEPAAGGGEERSVARQQESRVEQGQAGTPRLRYAERPTVVNRQNHERSMASIYARPSYASEAYLESGNQTQLAIADEVVVEDEVIANPESRVSKTTGNKEIVFIRPIDWVDKSRLYVNHRHHSGCGCRYSYRYNPGYGCYYPVNCYPGVRYASGTYCVSTYGYRRLLGNGTYVRKQPCFSSRSKLFYGRSYGGTRLIAKTSNYGHSLSIGGCVRIGH